MKEICIIKLGADGDVLRTLPLAKAIRNKNKDSRITWITKGDIKSLIDNLDYIDYVENIAYTTKKVFDELYNFDIEPAALDLAVLINADKKYGFYSEGEYPSAFNPGAEYYLNTMFDDELKKKNKKTYQEMMFMAAELPYKDEGYEIILGVKEREKADKFIQENNLERKKIVGIHMGAGSRWPSKAWHKERLIEFIEILKNKGYDIILFGGPNEKEKHEEISYELNRMGIEICRNKPDNSKREFASLVSICDWIVCSDSFSLHVSLGLRKKTVALFFVTSPAEVEGYGTLTKISSPMLKDFFPEKSDEYNEELVKSISASEVASVLLGHKT